MRSTMDRLRHSILYELMLLAICTPLFSYLLHEPVAKIGGFGLMLSLSAMAWNYLYNLGFDRSLMALGRPLSPRGLRLRLIHAALFEVGFMCLTIPAVMWWMNYGLWQALTLELAFILIVPVYTLIYNWGYDLTFPMPAGLAAGPGR